MAVESGQLTVEKRLIDANYLVNKLIPNCAIEEGGIPLGDFDKHQKILALYPTEDAAPVVRCKDCRRWKYDAKKLCGFCDALICYRPDYFWCMYGERRTDDA